LFEDLTPEVFEPAPDRPAPSRLEGIPAGLSELRRVPSPVQEPEHFDSVEYQHWGINE
jgi:hypothetical protein